MSVGASSRREFLKGVAAAAVAHVAPLSASVVRPFLAAGDASSVRVLDTGWEFYRDSLDGPWEAWHGDEIAAWEKVTVPHCVNHYDACDPDTPYYRGQGWYRTTISSAVPANGGRVLLHFEGAGQTSRVWVNDVPVGTHVGGYDEFVFDITEALKAPAIKGAIKMPADTVALTVLTDNSRDLKRSPSDLSDFSLYGGLYRKVHLVTVPAVSIESVKITPTVVVGGSAKVRVEIERYVYRGEPAQGVPFPFTAFDPSGKKIYESAGNEVTEFVIERPELWGPGSPKLYSIAVRVPFGGAEQVMVERFGLKHIEFVDHGPFKLNGERLMLRGTQRHMDHAGYAAAQPEELVREEFRLMKEMGVNFVRLAHYQQTKLVLDLCDELGILVWEESTWCRSGIGDKPWKDQVKQAFTNTINQHCNHVSVLVWGLGNEDDWPNEYPTMDKDSIKAFMTEMNDLAHSLDSTRVTSFRRADFAREIPDTYSPSIWAGWYSGLYTEYQKSLETQRGRVKHLLHIEWGADSHARRHAEDPYLGLPHIDTGKGTAETGLAYRNDNGPARISRDGDWSETYACDLFDWHLKVQETLEWFAGSAQWIFKDFTTPLRAENPVPRINQKGLLERDMTKKEGYFVFQSYWAEKPMVRLYGHTWPVRWGAAGEQRMVRVYSNCTTAELFVNGKSVGEKKRDSQDFPCAGLRWMVPFAAGKNHLRVVAKKDGVTLADEVDFVYQTAKWGKPAKLHVAEIARGGETVTVEATLVDEAGVLCLDSKAVVRFTLAGGGRLMDNLGTSSGSRLVQMYNGRARISLARKGAANVVSVGSEGLAGAFVSLG